MNVLIKLNLSLSSGRKNEAIENKSSAFQLLVNRVDYCLIFFIFGALGLCLFGFIIREDFMLRYKWEMK